VGAKLPWIQSGRGRPAFNQAAVLGGAQWRGRVIAHTGEEILSGEFPRDGNPTREDLTTIGQQGHDRTLAGFLLMDGALLNDRAGMVSDIGDGQGQQIGTTQHRVNTHGEEREVPEVAGVCQNRVVPQ